MESGRESRKDSEFRSKLGLLTRCRTARRANGRQLFGLGCNINVSGGCLPSLMLIGITSNATMKIQFIVLTLTTAALVLGGCASSPQESGFPPLQTRTRTPESITLKTFGPPGQQFSGLLTVDGVHREISGVTPAEYPIECVLLSGVVTNMSSNSERFGFEVSRTNGRFFTPGTDTVCTFRYHAGSLEVLTAR